jgi:predicted RNA-binding protein YlxR (DUF448 family)
MAAEPIRTCLGCRRRAPAAELVRLRLEAGRIVIEGRAGRGASIHAEASCLGRASKAGAYARAFKRPAADIVVPEPREFLERLMAAAARTPRRRRSNTENGQR